LFFLLGACNAPAPTTTGTLEAEASYWQQLGGTVGTGNNVSLVSDGTSNTIAFPEGDGSVYNITVKRWNGNTWSYLSNGLSGSRDAKDIVLGVGSDNRPVVAWEESGNIYVKRWNGSSWMSVGGIVDKTPANEALRPALELRTDNNPVVTWQEWNGSSSDVFVKRWTGSSWAQITVNAADKTLSRNAERPGIVLESDNNPIISWDEEDGTSENVFVRQF
jgi:hypothetical protein